LAIVVVIPPFQGMAPTCPPHLNTPLA